MRAIGSPKIGPLSNLQEVEIDAPVPGPNQVLVRVICAAVNGADELVLTGSIVGGLLHKKVRPLVVGYDFSGPIEAVGEGVSEFAVGDEVFGFLPYDSKTAQGTFSERVVVDRLTIARKPAEFSHARAAAAATPALTALQSMRDLGRLQEGGHVLIIGASGGVGSLGVGVAHKLGARVTAVCSAHAVEFVRDELGAETVVDRKKQNPLKLKDKFDVVFDAAAAHTYARTARMLKPGGAYVSTLPSVGWMTGKLRTLFSKRSCDLVGVKPRAADLELVARWMVEGMLVPIDDRRPVREVKAAIEGLSKGGMKGRIVIEVEHGF